MGFLNRFKGGERPALPSGSFTVDRDGNVIASTISSRFPPEQLAEVSSLVLQRFAEAKKAGLSLAELSVRLGAMSIRAVEMRGGAMIFLAPRGEPHNPIPTKK